VKKTFVLLQKLSELWADDTRWQANVQASGLADDYTLIGDEDSGELVVEDYAADELEFVADGVVHIYNFMGGDGEEESFYGCDEVVYKVKATGDYCVMWREGIDDV
jgi:hypothetical protein